MPARAPPRAATPRALTMPPFALPSLPLVTAALLLAAIRIGAFLVAAWTDLSRRIIPDTGCLIVALAGLGARALAGPMALLHSLMLAFALFVLLLLLHARGALGGGDVKLLAAASLGLAPLDVLHLLTLTALIGGVLALCQLALRRLPRLPTAPRGAGLVRRIYGAELWRAHRGRGLPYGIAIAAGGVAVLTGRGFG